MTLALFLLPYGLALFVWALLSIFALYHLIRFGIRNFTTFLITFSYIAASVILLFLWYGVIAENTTWTKPIFTIFTGSPI